MSITDVNALTGRMKGTFTFERVRQQRRIAADADRSYRQKVWHALSQTHDAIESSLNTGKAAETALVVIGDMSAMALFAGATMLTGGAALEVLAMGASLKGIISYQDTRNAQLALFTAAAEFTVGVIGIKAGATPGQRDMALVDYGIATQMGIAAGQGVSQSGTGDVRRNLAVQSVSVCRSETFRAVTSSAFRGSKRENVMRTVS